MMIRPTDASSFLDASPAVKVPAAVVSLSLCNSWELLLLPTIIVLLVVQEGFLHGMLDI